MKVKHEKLDNGKTLRTSTLDTREVIADKLSNKEMLETHDSQIDIYNTKTGEIVERKYMFYYEAVEFGQQVKAEFKDLGYRIIQVVE